MKDGLCHENQFPGAKISKDAKETIQECVSEFISFITSEGKDSNFQLLRNARKTSERRLMGMTQFLQWKLQALMLTCQDCGFFLIITKRFILLAVEMKKLKNNVI